MDTLRAFIRSSFIIFITPLVLLGCKESDFTVNQITDQTSEGTDQGVPEAGTEPNRSDDSSSVSPEPLKKPITSINFCSRLQLMNIQWPKSLSTIEVDSYALALNITGSFEGHSDWKNITNNFDDQGMSLGIFQQNLGQGSLQPLLIEMAEEYGDKSIFREYFTRTQANSIYGMLEDWDSNDRLGLASIDPSVHRAPASSEQLLLDESLTRFYSPLDIEDQENIKPQSNNITAQAFNERNLRSVNWAISNLYLSNGRTFKGDWKEGFQALASDPRYITKQVKAGHVIHKKAMRFMNIYKAKELKSYLFFFDIVVQNGGIRESTRQKYLAEVNQTPNMSENDRMKVLIKHRVLRSREQYRADVLSRKLALLNGKGVVHKTNRDFRSEFCLSQYDENIK